MPPDAQATAVAATETDLSNDFDAVFDAITNGTIDDENATSQAADGSDHAADNDDKSGQPGDGTGDPAKPAAAGGDTPAADGTGQPAGADDDAAGGDKGNAAPVDYAAQIASMQAELAALKAPPAPAPAADTPAKDIPIYTEAETAELSTLQKDWPDIKRLVELMTRQTEVNMVKYTFSEMGKILAPLQQSVGVLTGNDHVDALYSAHADYDQAYNPCMEWIGKQPAFLKNAYENVVKNGTSAEVIEMMQKFKDETKWVAPTAAAPAATAPAAKQPAKPQGKAELSVAAKQAAQAIGAVGTKRGGAPAAQDPTDFDGAWDEAIASK